MKNANNRKLYDYNYEYIEYIHTLYRIYMLVFKQLCFNNSKNISVPRSSFLDSSGLPLSRLICREFVISKEAAQSISGTI